MDYDKKKVEEAFALLKELYPIMNDYTKEKIAGIIPEIKESDDEMIRKGLLETFKNAQFGEWGKLKIKDIIAWLEKQKEQKPIDWSEDDERMIQSTIWHLRNSVNNGDIEHTAGQLENWLKSIHPSWKPSEEQMKALEHFIRSWGESGTMSPQNTILCAAKSLYADLQELL